MKTESILQKYGENMEYHSPYQGCSYLEYQDIIRGRFAVAILPLREKISRKSRETNRSGNKFKKLAIKIFQQLSEVMTAFQDLPLGGDQRIRPLFALQLRGFGNAVQWPFAGPLEDGETGLFLSGLHGVIFPVAGRNHTAIDIQNILQFFAGEKNLLRRGSGGGTAAMMKWNDRGRLINHTLKMRRNGQDCKP